MKQFHKTSYSKNKGSEDIVYRSVTGDYSISQEAFLDSDPALRADCLLYTSGTETVVRYAYDSEGYLQKIETDGTDYTFTYDNYGNASQKVLKHILIKAVCVQRFNEVLSGKRNMKTVVMSKKVELCLQI